MWADPICAVVAETYAQARDAAEAIEVDIEELEPVVDMKAALAEGAPKVHDESDLEPVLTIWGFCRRKQGRGERGVRERRAMSCRWS